MWQLYAASTDAIIITLFKTGPPCLPSVIFTVNSDGCLYMSVVAVCLLFGLLHTLPAPVAAAATPPSVAFPLPPLVLLLLPWGDKVIAEHNSEIQTHVDDDLYFFFFHLHLSDYFKF